MPDDLRGIAHGAEVEEGAFGIPPVLVIEDDASVVVMFRTAHQSRHSGLWDRTHSLLVQWRMREW